MKNELKADIYEALERLKLYTPVYLSVLKKTGSKEQALEAIKYLMRFDYE